MSKKIGWIGLGRMGEAMVTKLLKAGHAVQVWNRTASKAAHLAEYGATDRSPQDRPGDLRRGLHHGLHHRRSEGGFVRRRRPGHRQHRSRRWWWTAPPSRRKARPRSARSSKAWAWPTSARRSRAMPRWPRPASCWWWPRARSRSTTWPSRFCRPWRARPCGWARASWRASGRSHTTPCSASSSRTCARSPCWPRRPASRATSSWRASTTRCWVPCTRATRHPCCATSRSSR